MSKPFFTLCCFGQEQVFIDRVFHDQERVRGTMQGIDVESYYRQFAPMVFRRCLFLLKREENALDLTQEVFVQLLRYKDRLKHQGPSSLLYTIATRLCLNQLRRKTLGQLTEEVAVSDRSENLVLSRVLLDRIFEREKDDTRLIAVYHYVDGMTLEETAQMAGLSVSGVRKRLKKLQERASSFKEDHYVR